MIALIDEVENGYVVTIEHDGKQQRYIEQSIRGIYDRLIQEPSTPPPPPAKEELPPPPPEPKGQLL